MQTEKLNGTARALVEPERRALRRSLGRRRYRLSVMGRTALAFGAAVFGIPAGIVAAVTRSIPPLLPAVAWFLIVQGCVAWAYFSAKRELVKDINRFEKTLLRNEAFEVRVQSAEMVEFEEEEDEGACYAFQLNDGRILFISGQDFYPSARFPNTDFSLADIYDEDGVCIEELIYKRGRKLEPCRTVPARVKSEMLIPGHREIIKGKLAELEGLLLTAQANRELRTVNHA